MVMKRSTNLIVLPFPPVCQCAALRRPDPCSISKARRPGVHMGRSDEAANDNDAPASQKTKIESGTPAAADDGAVVGSC